MNMLLRKKLKMADNRLRTIGYSFVVDYGYVDIRPNIPRYEISDDLPEAYLRFSLVKKPVGNGSFHITCSAFVCTIPCGNTQVSIAKSEAIARLWLEYLKVAREITEMRIVCSNEDAEICVNDINMKKRK